MFFQYRCIDCGQPLSLQEGCYCCARCPRQYKVFAGVPNFKKGEIYPGEERVLAELAQRYDELGFVELLEYADSREDKNSLPWELRRSMRFKNKSEQEQKQALADYSREVIVKSGQEQMHITEALLSYADNKAEIERVLDIGCGRGPWAVIAASLYRQVFALDMDMASLIIARKYCDTQGIDNITFFSAFSSALPLPDDCFDLINSQAVLEHVDIQLKSLQEIRRVLKAGGVFTGDSVNRYNLVTPEPHIELRLVTCLPKSWAHRLSLALKNMPYDDIKPLSYKELSAMLQESFSTKFKVVPFVESLRPSLTQSLLKRMPACFQRHFTHTHFILGGK